MTRRTIDRRGLLLGGTLGGLFLTSSSARAALRVLGPALPGAGSRKSLVLVQLSGGNDGLSTLVPYGDDAYHAARETIGVAAGDVLRLDDYRGLHPNLKHLRRIWDEGHLALVQGCGYPDPVRSHFRSMEIWHTADPEGRHAGAGWIGRLAETAWRKDPTVELVVHIGDKAPYSLYSAIRPPIAFATPQGYRWAGQADEVEAYRGAADHASSNGALARLRGTLSDADASSRRIREAAALYRPQATYPTDQLADGLRTVAALLAAGMTSRVYSLEVDGFDTHETQKRKHDNLMGRLDRCLGAFHDDLRGTSLADDVVVVVFSEFGRRVAENGSKGTDHGVAGPMLVMGGGVKGGLYGEHPSLTELDDGDLVFTTDFRSVYGEVVERWFDVEQSTVLGDRYPKLGFLG
jgi:uncharacterized protein (DUF1501 family)